jgi:HEAT repeat protein
LAGKIGASDAATIKDASLHAGQATRELAIRALAKVGDTESLDIARSYLNDSFRHFRAAAVFALGEAREQADIERLRTMKADSAPAVRQETESALAKLHSRFDCPAEAD